MMRIVPTVVLSAVLITCTLAASIYPGRNAVDGWQLKAHKKVDKYEVVRMSVGLKRRNMEKAEEVFWRVSDPRSLDYGDHLDDKGVAELVGAGQAAIRSVMGWLERNGVPNAKLARHEDYIYFDATLETVETLLGVTFRAYYSQREGRTVNRALDAVVLADEVAQYVEVIGGHRGFPLRRNKRGAKTVRGTRALATKMQNVTPAVLQRTYNVLPPEPPAGVHNLQAFFQAQGQSVDSADLKEFCRSFLPQELWSRCAVTKYIGPNTPIEPGTESLLDSQYIFAMGWGTETWVFSYGSIDFCADLLNWGHDVFETKRRPYVISMSYGSQQLPTMCGKKDVHRISHDIMKMGLMGISVLIASGDSGNGQGGNYGLLSPSMPAEIPYCTSVGATTFVNDTIGNAQMATFTFGSGGGFSFNFAAPAYQREAIKGYFASNQKQLPPPLSYNAAGRGTPDLSALGSDFTIVNNGGFEAVSGTSASTPTVAGLISLLNNIRLANGKTLGFLNPLLYQNPRAFTDITLGNNEEYSTVLGWYTSRGWDPVTGLGTPDFRRLAEIVRGINAAERIRGKHRKNGA